MSCGDVPDEVVGEMVEEKIMPRKKEIRRTDRGTCQRCQKAKTLYIIRTVACCAPCFRHNVLARVYRQMYPPLRIGKMSRAVAMSHTRPGKTGGNALIALSGGAGSTALFDLLTDEDANYVGKKDAGSVEKKRGAKEPIWERGTCVYVEFCGVVDGAKDRTDEMRKMAEERGMDFVGLRAEDVFDPDLGVKLGRAVHDGQMFADLSHPDLPIASSSTSQSPLESLRNLLTTLPPPSRPSLLSRILDHLLALAANSLPNISHFLLGETSSRQAERIISGTALGRGWALPLELAASYKLPQAETNQVTQLKPFKDITTKEAAIWCYNSKVPTMNSRGWGSVKGKDDGKRDARGKGGVASLEMLTEQFIAGLSVTHPSTVSTINRTGEKLVFPGDADKTLCPVCEHPVDPSALDWKNRTALMTLPTKDVEPTTAMSENTDSRLAPLLCYSCLTTFTPTRIGKQGDPIEPVLLPLWVGQRVSAQDMKKSIGSFLLDEDEHEDDQH